MKGPIFLFSFILLFNKLLAQDAVDKSFEQSFDRVEAMTYDISKFDEAYKLTDDMLRQAASEHQKGLANFAKAEVIVKNGWGYYLGEFGLPYLVNAINSFIKTDNKKMLSDALNTLSVSYISKYNPNNLITSSKELTYLRMALKVANDPNYIIEYPFSATLNDRNTTQEEINETLGVVSEDLEMAIKSRNLNNQMYRTEKLGYLYWQLDHTLDRAEVFLLNAIDLAEINHNEIFKSICFGQLCVYANQAKNFEKVIFYGQKGLEQIKDGHLDFRESIFRDQLYHAYKALGKQEEANNQKSASIDRYDLIQAETQIKRQNMVIDRIKQLEYNNVLEKELLAKNQRLTIFYIVLAALLILFSYFAYSNLQLRKKNKEITEASFKGQTLERKRVAADLHDNLGSTISSVQWIIDSLDPKELNEKQNKVLTNIRELIQKAYGDIRLLSHNLLPQTLEEVGLVGALTELNKKMNKNPHIKFNLDIDPSLGRMAKRIEFELYSICLELYSNIMHHSEATEAHTTLSLHDGILSMNISDNGKGFDQNSKEGMGLENIKDRVASINAQWEIKNGVNNGMLHDFKLKVG